MEDSHSAPESKTGLACVTGIQEECRTEPLAKGLMCMAKDNRVRFVLPEPGLQPVGGGMGMDDVVQQEFSPGEAQGFGKRVLEAGIIGVSTNGSHRRDLLQFEENLRRPNISGVEDMVDTLKKGDDLRVEKVVGIGDYADSEGIPESGIHVARRVTLCSLRVPVRPRPQVLPQVFLLPAFRARILQLR